MNKTIGKRLMLLRGKKSRKEVAEGIGVTPSAVAMYERGERVPRDDIKIRYAKFFGKTVESIFFAK
ncbi:MAG: helix-turn-helix transcriptional regulator [Clostridia bacterium]|nr:helix-turn-helix transcriptional regulator [Clostridia bacterium]